MNKNLNLQPLQEYLTMGISPQELSNNLDELIFDYIRLVIFHALQPEDEDAYVHIETNEFIFHLRELRDKLRECAG